MNNQVEVIERDPMDMMYDYPFKIIDKNGEIQYITDEYIHHNWNAKQKKAFVESLTPEEALLFDSLKNDWTYNARKKQRPPLGDYDYIIAICGRSWGKTMFGSNWLIQKVKSGVMYTAIAGATEKDLINTMINGKSGIIKNAPADFKPILNKTEMTLTWPNGGITYCLSAESEEGPRGSNIGAAWIDEIVKFKRLEEFWSNIEYAMREGECPQTLFTSTPRKVNIVCSKFMNKMIKDGAYVINGGSRENYKISERVFKKWEKRYGGTQKGREEMEGILDLNETDGAVFSQLIIEDNRVSELPQGVRFTRKIVSIDPSVSNTDTSDECGLVVLGYATDEKAYLIEDLSEKMHVSKWAEAAIEAYHKYGCSEVVAETNNGGDLVEEVIKIRDSSVVVKQVKAVGNKAERASPVADLYQQGRVCHLGNEFFILEEQMVEFDPANKKNSPDRMDAVVWGVIELIIMIEPDAEEWLDAYRNKCLDKIVNLPNSSRGANNIITNKEKFFDDFMALAKQKYGRDFSQMSIFNDKI